MRNFERVAAAVADFNSVLTDLKSTFEEIPWYPHGILNNFTHLKPLISDEIDQLFADGMRFADVGAADGDLSFFLETFGNHGDIYDFGPTNYNGLRGARAIKSARHSDIGISEINLDAYFNFERTYDIIFFLGILYHLKNPFYVLEHFAHKSRYMLLSTRIARHLKAGTEDVSKLSAAYLLAADESNGDATNFWIFTEAGLKRILDRSGWDVISYRVVGDTIASNPQDNEHDARAFCALRSRCYR